MFNNIKVTNKIGTANIIVRFLIFLLSFTFLTSCKDGSRISWKIQNFPTKKPSPILKVYIENSGSMDGYMCEGSELKDAVYDYISSLNSYASSTNLFYINSQVVPFHEEIQTFIRDLNPTSFRTVSGNRTNSDLADMLQKVIAGTDKNTVSVFVSDCILDVPQGDARDYFVNRQIDLKNAFLKKVVHDKNFGVEIIQLESRFSGKYYGTDGVTPLNNVKRPYYMWVVGDKNILAYLNRHISLSKIKHGYLNMASFTTPSEISYDCFNRYMKDGKKFNQNKKQMELKSDRSGDFVFVIKADLYPTLVDDKTLTNTENFKVSNNFVKVDHVEKIEDELYSHLITVSISDRAKASGVVIDLTPEQLPSWVKKSNDDTGSNIKTKLSKTSGIQYIIGGVSDAYNEYKSRTKIKFTITKN